MTTDLLLLPAIAFVSVTVSELIAAMARGLRQLSTRRRLAAERACCLGRCTTADHARRAR